MIIILQYKSQPVGADKSMAEESCIRRYKEKDYSESKAFVYFILNILSLDYTLTYTYFNMLLYIFTILSENYTY